MRYRHHYNVIVKKTNLLSAERGGRWVLECVWGLQRHRSTSQRDARRRYDVECGSLFIDTDCRRDAVDVMLAVTCCCDWPPRRLRRWRRNRDGRCSVARRINSAAAVNLYATETAREASRSARRVTPDLITLLMLLLLLLWWLPSASDRQRNWRLSLM